MKLNKVPADPLPPEAQKVLELFPEFALEQFNDSGANGYVLIGQHQVLKQSVAIKIYFHGRHEIDEEPALLASINHENVLKVLDARRLGDESSFFMTPAANYGDLRKFLNQYNLSLSLAHSLLCQLLSGLSALHAEPNRLVHRDVKPENLLVHDNKLLIADFGSVRKVSVATGKAPASKHSILFRPPEAFGPQPYFDYSSDTYQAGLIGYLLLGGQLDNDLVRHLNSKERTQLASIECDWAEKAMFVDTCIGRRICSGRLIDWGLVPCFVPKRFVTVLRRATTKTGSTYANVSELLAKLQILRPTLPEWIITTEGWRLDNWRGRDYLLIVEEKPVRTMKRKHGKEKWITDNSLSGGSADEVYGRLSKEVGLP